MEAILQESRSDEESPELRARFRAGDEGAFDAVVAAHRKTVYRMARRLLGNHADADEAAQLTFLRAWRARTRFRGDSKLSTWLVRIALNVAKTLRSRAAPEGATADWDLLRDAAEGPEERLRKRETRRRVRRAVEGLPPRQREVVLLKIYSEMTHGEVAAVLELTEGAVKAHLHQALRNLRRRMADVERAEGG